MSVSLKSESIGKISAALLKAQKSMGDASKGAKNPFYKSSYADLNSIREAVTPALNDNGISVLQPMETHEGKSFVITMLLHESGEYISSMTEVVVAKQNDPQGTGSGISYARRYGLQSFLSVGAVDDDGETAQGRSNKSPTPNYKAASAKVSAPAAVKSSGFKRPGSAAKPAVAQTNADPVQESSSNGTGF